MGEVEVVEARLDVLRSLLEVPECEVYVRLRLDKGLSHEEAVKLVKVYLPGRGDVLA